MTLQLDVQKAISDAAQAGALAASVRDHAGLQAAFKRLEAFYIQQIRNSAPTDTEGREASFLLLRALDQLRQDIEATISGAEVTSFNLQRRQR
jgi:hypothetical protein